jgi:hypothetical protein
MKDKKYKELKNELAELKRMIQILLDRGQGQTFTIQTTPVPNAPSPYCPMPYVDPMPGWGTNPTVTCGSPCQSNYDAQGGQNV